MNTTTLPKRIQNVIAYWRALEYIPSTPSELNAWVDTLQLNDTERVQLFKAMLSK